MTSLGVLVGLALVAITGATWIDPVVALVIAVAIVYTGLQGRRRARGACSSTRRCPRTRPTAIREAIESFGARGVAGYHELRTRRAGPRRYVDVHIQFRSGTTLEDAHAIAHASRTRSASACATPTCSSTSSPRTACGRARRSARGGERRQTPH